MLGNLDNHAHDEEDDVPRCQKFASKNIGKGAALRMLKTCQMIGANIEK